MTKLSSKDLSMQYLAGGDNNRTSVAFQGLDNCGGIGVVTSGDRRVVNRRQHAIVSYPL